MNINDLIYLQNPWYRDKEAVPREHLLPKRNLFKEFYDEILATKQIISLTGLRRVGKSTLIKQCIAKIIREGQEPTKILYFSFDQPTVDETNRTLEKIIEIYLNKFLKKKVNYLDEKTFLFFDEIQLIPYWQDVLKRYYDINQNIKFVVTGSSSLFLSKNSKESLAGRIFEKYLPPLLFSEYKTLSKKVDFIDYLDFGQFPELFQIDNKSRKIDYLKDGVIGKILEVDIVKSYGIRKTVDFERLFWTLLPNVGQIIQSGRLMSDLQLKKATLFKYLTILEKSLLINKVLNLSGSFRSEKRLLRKLYPASTNLLSLIPEPVNIGFKAENYVASVLKTKTNSLYLYNHRGKEVDFVIPDKGVAVEVKYQEIIRPGDFKFLEKYIREKNYRGIIVSKNEKKQSVSKNIIQWPIESFEELKI